MIHVFLAAIRAGFVEKYFGIHDPVTVPVSDDTPVFNDTVFSAFKRPVLIRTDKDQFHISDVILAHAGGWNWETVRESCLKMNF